MVYDGATKSRARAFGGKLDCYEDLMDHLDILALTELHWYDRWTLAERGALLQVRIRDHIRIGMRTSFQAANGERDGLVILGGDDAGVLVTEGVDGPALDVSPLVMIVAVNPAPFERAAHLLPRGALLRYAEQDVYFVWVQMNGGNVTGGVCIQSDEQNVPVGTCYSKLTRRVIGVAEKVDLRRIEIE